MVGRQPYPLVLSFGNNLNFNCFPNHCKILGPRRGHTSITYKIINRKLCFTLPGNENLICGDQSNGAGDQIQKSLQLILLLMEQKLSKVKFSWIISEHFVRRHCVSWFLSLNLKLILKCHLSFKSESPLLPTHFFYIEVWDFWCALLCNIFTTTIFWGFTSRMMQNFIWPSEFLERHTSSGIGFNPCRSGLLSPPCTTA